MTESCSCDDYNLSRRNFLAAAGALSAAGIVTSMFGDVMTSTAYGATNGNVLVVLSLRGGADGLSLVVPHAEQNYYKQRPGVSLKATQLLHADATFGLHPSFAPLSPMWAAGKMAAVHATGMPTPNRSHFEAMELLEDADIGSPERIGWLNRMISSLADPTFFAATQLGTFKVPTALYGPNRSLAISTFASAGMPFSSWMGATDQQRQRAAYEAMHADAKGAMTGLGRQALDFAAQVEPIRTIENNRPNYGNGSLGSALRSSAALIKAGVGVQAIAVDSDGWDHHVDVTWNVSNRISQIAGALKAFFDDLGPDAERVTVVTVSEFGRRLTQNGSAGVDHGFGNVMLALGGGVKGGYYANWPTLEPAALIDGDLAVTTDYRNVIGEILKKRFPSVSISEVFPGVTYKEVGFIR